MVISMVLSADEQKNWKSIGWFPLWTILLYDSDQRFKETRILPSLSRIVDIQTCIKGETCSVVET